MYEKTKRSIGSGDVDITKENIDSVCLRGVWNCKNKE